MVLTLDLGLRVLELAVLGVYNLSPNNYLELSSTYPKNWQAQPIQLLLQKALNPELGLHVKPKPESYM